MTMWFLARGAGLAALVVLTLSVVLGAANSDRASTAAAGVVRRGRQLDRRILQQLAHRSAGLVGVTLLIMHIVLIVLDSHVSVSVGGVVVPFTAGYAPVALGLGSIALYLMVLTALSGLARGQLASSSTGARWWRGVHLLAFAGWGLAMFHGVLAGTDTGMWWTTAVYLGCGLAVLVAVLLRLARADRRDRRPLVRLRRLSHGGAQR